MPQQVFIKVVGFNDVERQALSTVFRLSEAHPTSYWLWNPQVTPAPQLLFLDSLSEEARRELQSPHIGSLKVAWFGDDAPADVWRSFPRTPSWDEVLAAMDELFAPPAEIDFDLDLGGIDEGPDTVPPDEIPPEPEPARRALIANADLGERLYLRAKLALNHVTVADEAETPSQVMELMRAHPYTLALVDYGIADGEGWDFIRRLTQGERRIPRVIVTKADAGFAQRLRAKFAGAEALLAKPPDPERLQELLQKH